MNSNRSKDPKEAPMDPLEEHCIGELFDAIESKDVVSFRQALEAFVMNCFEEEKAA